MRRFSAGDGPLAAERELRINGGRTRELARGAGRPLQAPDGRRKAPDGRRMAIRSSRWRGA